LPASLYEDVRESSTPLHQSHATSIYHLDSHPTTSTRFIFYIDSLVHISVAIGCIDMATLKLRWTCIFTSSHWIKLCVATTRCLVPTNTMPSSRLQSTTLTIAGNKRISLLFLPVVNIT